MIRLLVPPLLQVLAEEEPLLPDGMVVQRTE